jgi:hypothetical protein
MKKNRASIGQLIAKNERFSFDCRGPYEKEEDSELQDSIMTRNFKLCNRKSCSTSLGVTSELIENLRFNLCL